MLLKTSVHLKKTRPLDSPDSRGGVIGEEPYFLLHLNIISSVPSILISRFILCWTRQTIHTSPQDRSRGLPCLGRRRSRPELASWVLEQDSKDIPGVTLLNENLVTRMFEACGVLPTPSNSTSAGCWLLNGNIQIREEMTVHSKQNCTHLDRLRK